MFRRWPFFQRLLSWTKPYAPAARGTRAYERYDWNSLIPDDDEHRAIQAELMDGTSYFPSRPEMEASIAAFAERNGVRGPLRLSLGVHPAARRRPVRARDERRASTSRRRSSSRSASPSRGGPATPGHGARRPLRRHAAGRDVRRQAHLHRRQAELGLRAGVGPAAVGAPDRDRLAQPGQAVGQHALAGRDPGPLPPAVRGPRARRRRRHPRCVDRGDRAGSRRRPRRPDPAVERRTQRWSSRPTR